MDFPRTRDDLEMTAKVRNVSAIHVSAGACPPYREVSGSPVSLWTHGYGALTWSEPTTRIACQGDMSDIRSVGVPETAQAVHERWIYVGIGS